ncbi:MAG: EAL domain-containing protein [Pseudomonadota bacterium]
MILKQCEPTNTFSDYDPSIETEAFEPDAATLSQMLDAICITDLSWKILFWNEGAQKLFGRHARAAIGQQLQHVLPAVFQWHFPSIESALRSRQHWRSTIKIRSENDIDIKTGVATNVTCQFKFDYETDGKPCRILMSGTPMPDWTGGERREVMQERQPYATDDLFDRHPEGMLTLDIQGRLLTANHAAERLTGYTACELHRMTFTDLLGCTSQLHDLRKILAQAFDEQKQSGEFLLRSKEGILFDVLLTLLPDVADQGNLGVYGFLRDISIQKEDQRRVSYLAQHDALTGLPNRCLLESRMVCTFDTACLADSMVGVLFLDLNRFKVVNDSLGHDKGDELLRAVANRLIDAARPGDTVARLGGDEFVVILKAIEDIADIRVIAESLARAITAPIFLDGDTICITASVGASIFPNDGTDATSLLKHAELAMYAAKKLGNDCFKLYDPQMNARALARLSSENSLRDAIASGHMLLHFQPRLDLLTNRIVGVEALVRWNHPDKGLIYPSDFIALAEETGMINALGKWVLTSACNQMVAWRKLGVQPIRMSVNMSAIQLQSPHVSDMVAEVITTADFDPCLLELEITESSLMADIDASVETLLRFKNLGISLSIDDFGTGYSCLTYLKRLPISTLKIDRSFVRNLSVDKNDAAIVSATIAMAHSMDLKVVAEGVTTFEQRRFLESCRCDEIQGYLVCQPLPASELESYLIAGDLRGIQHAWIN